MRGLDGHALRRLAGLGGDRYFLRGMWPKRPTVAHCAALGPALARLRCRRRFPDQRANDLSVAGWRPIYEAAAHRSEGVAPDLAAEIDTELEMLEKRWPRMLPAGVIHADLFPDNVFFEGERLSGLIDFYFACIDSLAYDLAVCLNAWCFEE